MRKVFTILLGIFLVAILITGCSGRLRDRYNENHPPVGDNSNTPPVPSDNTAPTVAGRDVSGTLQVGSQSREYLLHIPKGYSSSKKFPLVVVLHGGSQDNTDIEKITGFSELADQEGILVVYPQGMEQNWDDGRGTTDASKAGADDISFIRNLVSELEGAYSVDASRVYATGTSNGGIMTHRLGCELSDVFVAIAPVIGSPAANIVDTCNPPTPVSVMVIQGTADPFIDINGGEVKHKRFPMLGDGGIVVSADEGRRLWAKNDGCTGSPTTEELPILVDDGTSVEKIAYTDCKANTEVVYYIVSGMGHTYPPKTPEKAGNIVGTASKNIDATKEIWKFFKSHSR